MTGFQRSIATLGGLAAAVALLTAIFGTGAAGIALPAAGLLLVGVGIRHHLDLWPQARVDLVASLGGMALLMSHLDGDMPAASWPLLIACWLFGWLAVEKTMAARHLPKALSSVVSLAVPVFFGAWIIFAWEVLTVGLQIPTVLLPPPSMIAVRFAESTSILWADFQQTVIKAALSGYILGCGSA